MLAYNKELLRNIFLRRTEKKLSDAGFISERQLDFISRNLGTLRRSGNIIVRAGFFILGALLCGACAAVLGLIVQPASGIVSFMLFLSVVYFATLELFIIRTLKYYCQGIDKAFLFFAQSSLVAAVVLSSNRYSLSVFFIASAVTGLGCFLRYSDRFSLLLLVGGLAGYLAILVIESRYPAGLLAPASALCFAVTIQAINIKTSGITQRYWPFGRGMLTVCAVLIAYLGTNLFILRTLAATALPYGNPPDISFPAIFVLLTIVNPVIIIVAAVRHRSRELVWTGLTCAAFSAFSIRQYYQVAPLG